MIQATEEPQKKHRRNRYMQPQEPVEYDRTKLSAAEQQALHLVETTNIPKTQVSRQTGVPYARVTKLQYDAGINRPEQVFGLPKHDVPVLQRKPRRSLTAIN